MVTQAIVMVLAAVTLSGGALAHDASKHKGKPVQGEVISVADDRFEIRTAGGIVPVTFSSKTKFEHGTATVDKTHVTKGERVSVFGTKLPTGELVAREVLIGSSGAHQEHGPKSTAKKRTAKTGSTKQK